MEENKIMKIQNGISNKHTIDGLIHIPGNLETITLITPKLLVDVKMTRASFAS